MLDIQKTIHYKITIEGEDVAALNTICNWFQSYQIPKVSKESTARSLGITLEEYDAIERLVDNLLTGLKGTPASDHSEEVIEVNEYKDHDFCKSVQCKFLKSTLVSSESIKVNKCTIDICQYTARNFHKWLKKNNYRIVR